MDAMPFTVSGMTDRKHDSKEPVESRPSMKAKISGFLKRHEEKIVTIGVGAFLMIVAAAAVGISTIMLPLLATAWIGVVSLVPVLFVIITK